MGAHAREYNVLCIILQDRAALGIWNEELTDAALSFQADLGELEPPEHFNEPYGVVD